MNNEQWQVIPGTNSVEVYPLIIKPNINSSNAFIISTDENIILVDTGASTEQMGRIKSVIRQLMVTKDRPVIILLTHCHADHCLMAFSDQELSDIVKVRIAIQENGVQPLEAKDERQTLADIQRKVLSNARIDLVLLSRQDKENPGEKMLHLGDGINLLTIIEKIDPGDKSDFYRQIIKIGTDASMEIYPMPGHSPDSICIRIGELLFAGDFFFAINHLIAGAVGWNQKDMMESIRHMRWLAQNTDINLFCTGHGNPLSRGKAMEHMNSMLDKTARMADLSELNCQHMMASSSYALELLEELNDTMAIIAGRLDHLIYYLDYLGELEQSEKYNSILDFNKIDELLAEYHDFANLFEAGNIAYPTLIMKAAQLTGKIEKIFAQDGIDGVMDKCLFRRVQRSFSDFMQITGGMPIDDISEVLDINQLIADLLQQMNSVPYNDNILEVLDNDAQYINDLVSRIAFQPVFREVLIDFQPAFDLPMVEIYKDRFCDALLGILEEITAIDIKEIHIVAVNANDSATLRISSPKGIPEDVLNEKKRQLYQRKFAVLGGELNVERDQDRIAFIIKLS